MRYDEFDDLIGQWHALAALERPALEAAFAPNAVQLLQSVRHHALGRTDFPAPLTADTFSDAVSDLRENERTWSRQLGDVIIQANATGGDKSRSSAIAVLKNFIENCPWQSFRRIADDELSNHI